MFKNSAVAVAALVATASLAFAQDPGGAQPGQGAGNAPSAAGGAPGQMNESGGSARDQAPGQTKPAGESARDQAPGQTKPAGESARDQAPGQKKDDGRAGGDKPKTGKDASNDEMKKDGKSARGESKPTGDQKAGAPEKAGDAKDEAASDNRKNADSDGPKNADKDGADKGKSKDKASLSEVPAEKKAEVKTTFSRHRVEPARDIGISINVGVSVPRKVRLYPIPQDIVILVPAYSYYQYFFVDDRIVIVDPDTYEIVEIIIIV